LASFITFYKIAIPIYAFLPALQNLQDASAAEDRSVSSRLPGLPLILEVVTSRVIFQGPEQMVV
jgi:hypothetical protein